MTNITREPLKNGVWSLAAALILTSASVTAQSSDPNEFPVSDAGVMLATTAAANRTVMPFSGTGIRTAAIDNAIRDPLAPTVQEIRGLPPASSGIGIETVVGSDTRQRLYTTLYPTRATALVTFTGGFCTGWFYGPNVVATAGHCVHSGGTTGSWRTNVRVYPGYNAGSAPYGSFAAKWLASVTGWTQSRDERYDYGVIKLSTNAGNTVGWYGLWWTTASLTGQTSIIQGYPGDKTPSQSQWVGADEVRVTQDRQVFYKNDTADGMSGSAVWNDRPPGSAFCANGPCAFAIHAYGLHGAAPHSDHNHGTRITEAVFNNLIAWRDAP
jgi:glutamyl endopeptidase